MDWVGVIDTDRGDWFVTESSKEFAKRGFFGARCGLAVVLHGVLPSGGVPSALAYFQRSLIVKRGISNRCNRAPAVDGIASGQFRGERCVSEYLVGIVGESAYQAAIGRCRTGQTVAIEPEPANAFDARALRVQANGVTIGYIARDSWLQRAVHDERKTVRACIHSIKGAALSRGVVLEVSLGGEPHHGGGLTQSLRGLFRAFTR